MKIEQRLLLNYLTGILTQHPELRFWQALSALGLIKYDYDENIEYPRVIDDFYIMDAELLKRVRESVEEQPSDPEVIHEGDRVRVRGGESGTVLEICPDHYIVGLDYWNGFHQVKAMVSQVIKEKSND